MNQIGFMQGRLTDKGGFFPQIFPKENWEREFETASRMGFDCMEWMLNAPEWEENPILTKRGVQKICEKIKETKISVSGICVNYFMENSIFQYDAKAVEQNSNLLCNLAENAKKVGCQNIILPMFGSSEILLHDESDFLDLNVLLRRISDNGLYILFETDLAPGIMKTWLEKLDIKNTGICYDIGNAVGLGKDVMHELETYAGIIHNIHVKDKKKNGISVMLGDGDAFFKEYFRQMENAEYEGSYILETYYGESAIRDTEKNFKFVRDNMKK